MTPEDVTDAVVLLVRARRERQPLAGLPEHCRPRSAEDAYAIQDLFIRTWGDEAGGWKVGATNPQVQGMLGVEEPFYGPVFSPVLLKSPAELSLRALNDVAALECEFAFRLGSDLPQRAEPYHRDQILEAVQALIPALEIVTTRFDSLRDYGGLALIADCGANGALVLGEEVADWRGLDLATHPVRLQVDGEPQADGTGAAVLGHPLNALIWFVNRHNARGFGLRAGEVVTTGSATGMTMMEPGQEAVGDFGPLGQVRARFVA